MFEIVGTLLAIMMILGILQYKSLETVITLALNQASTFNKCLVSRVIANATTELERLLDIFGFSQILY